TPASGNAAVQAHLAVAAEAKAHAEAARLHLEKQRYSAAEEEFEKAVAKEPNVVLYRVGLAWATAVNTARPQDARLRKALELLRGVNSRYQNAEALYTEGMVLNLMGRDGEAEATFRRALENDKNHHGALRMVRLLEMRRQKEKEDAASPVAGILGLLKKK
ncbi:MAG: hypothetical protein AB2A00_38350, partial [Myxococcota bacterium]